MEHKIVAPSVGESITEVRILTWKKQNGEAVKAGEILVELETDKATVEVASEVAGALKILKQSGETVPVGAELAIVNDAVAGQAASAAPAGAATQNPAPVQAAPVATAGASNFALPAAAKMAAESGVNVSSVAGTGLGGRVTKGDVMAHMEKGAASAAPVARVVSDKVGDRRVPMSKLRQTIANRLVQAQHTAAILTTFNEVDLGEVMKIRSVHKESFKAKYGVGLGFMSFFTRACAMALKTIPAVNASIDGTDIVYHDYCDIGVAVGTDRGLVVPVLRGADKLTFAEIEKGIAALGGKAKDGKLSIADMSGGTFTISNGGTYGSMMSTPILNPPQSGILGMHKIMERPMAVNGKIELRSMMYLALSYDHRIIDGKEGVTFLVTIKDLLEHPEKLGMDFLNI
jgi:2-oxoglutarate dehydrogenase E2 component (dihydrolipoamide succinyltransferase)